MAEGVIDRVRRIAEEGSVEAAGRGERRARTALQWQEEQ